MGNIQPVNGRRPLTESHGFTEAFAHARNNLKEICQAAVTGGETGITIPYTALLVPNPNKDTYDDYLIGQEEIRRVLMEVVSCPFTVENCVIKAGDIVFYNQSSVKVLFVYGMVTESTKMATALPQMVTESAKAATALSKAAAVQPSHAPALPASKPTSPKHVAAAKPELIGELQPLDGDIEVIGI